MRNNNNIRISTDRTPIVEGVTEKSMALIKKSYAAMKYHNEFYRFQRSFKPMVGLNKHAESHAKSTRNLARIRIGDIKYNPFAENPNLKTKLPAVIPAFFDEISIYISRMLIERWDKNIGDFRKMEHSEFYDKYVKYVMKDYQKNRKLKPVSIMFNNLFGIGSTILFELSLFGILWITYPGAAFFLACLILVFLSLFILIIEGVN
jgi:hypothetical protein